MFLPSKGMGDFDWGGIANAIGSVAQAGASVYKSINAASYSPPAGITPFAYNFGIPSGLVAPPGITPGYQPSYYLPPPAQPASILSNPTTLTLIALGGVAFLFLIMRR